MSKTISNLGMDRLTLHFWAQPLQGSAELEILFRDLPAEAIKKIKSLLLELLKLFYEEVFQKSEYWQLQNIEEKTKPERFIKSCLEKGVIGSCTFGDEKKTHLCIDEERGGAYFRAEKTLIAEFTKKATVAVFEWGEQHGINVQGITGSGKTLIHKENLEEVCRGMIEDIDWSFGMKEKLEKEFPHLFKERELTTQDLDRAMHERMYNYIPRFRKFGLYIIPNVPGRKMPKVKEWTTRQDAVSVGPEDNYGIRCGEKIAEGDWYLIVLDFEDIAEAILMLGKELFEKMLKETLVVRSAHMGLHIYLLCNAVPKESIIGAVRKGDKNVMDLIGPGHQIIGPYSVINHRFCEKAEKCQWKKLMLERKEERDVYTAYERVSSHLKIAKIKKETLATLFKRIAAKGYELSFKLEQWLFGLPEEQKTIEPSKDLDEVVKEKLREVVEKTAQEKTREAGITIPIEKVLTAYGIKDLKQSGEELYGPHPVHGSTTGHNFWVNPSKNVWHCFRHKSGGSSIDLIGVLEGIIQCEEALEKLDAQKFRAIMEKAVEKGIITKEEFNKVFEKKKTESGIKTLNEAHIIEIKTLLKPAYRKGFRQLIWIFLSHWAAKAKIDPGNIATILKLLHAETQDEEDLRYRASALIYAYRKEKFVMEFFMNDLEQTLGLKLSEIPTNTINEQEIKTISGLRDILYKALNGDENQVIEIIDKLSEFFGKYSPFRDPVFVKYTGNYVFANMLDKIVLLEVEYDKKKSNKPKWWQKAVIISAGVSSLTEIKDPKTNEVYWKAVWELKRGGSLEIVGTVEDHLEALKAHCLIHNKRFAEDAIQAIFDAMVEKGYAERQLALETDGFYLDEKGQLQCSRLIPMDDKELKEGLKRGIRRLNEVAVFFDQNAFGSMIKVAVLLPLTYALKKAKSGIDNPRRVYLVGPPGCGKTTLALIAGCYIWGIEASRFFRPFKDISTEARMGRVLNQWTFPTLLDNASDLFLDEKYSNIRNMLNTAEEAEYVRSVHTGGRYTSIPSKSPLIFTIDSAATEKLEASDKRRAVVVRLGIEHLTQKDASERVREFNRRYGARCEKLSKEGDLMYIGQWLIRYYIQKWDAIKSKASWVEVVEETLNAMFDYAEEPKPKWSDAKIEDKEAVLESIYQDLKERVIEVIKRYVVDVIVQYGKKGEIENRKGFWNRLQYITDSEFPSEVLALENATKYGLRWQNAVVIKKRITDIFLREGIQLTNLKDLANLMGWEYRPNFVCRPLGIVNQSVVLAPLESFEDVEDIEEGDDKENINEITLSL